MKSPSGLIRLWHTHSKAYIWIFWLLGGCCLVLGCVPSKVRVRTASEFNPFSISRVAVLPFRIRQSSPWEGGAVQGTVRDPEEILTQFRLPGTDRLEVSRSSAGPEADVQLAAQRLTQRVVSALRGRPFLEVVGPPESSAAEASQPEDVRASSKHLAIALGPKLRVDGVIMGLVRTYREREGTKLGAKPAAVGFEMVLVDTQKGRGLWKGEYFEEQKPLTEDIVGFFEKGGGFVTADELAKWGVKEVLRSLTIGQEGTMASSPASSTGKGTGR